MGLCSVQGGGYQTGYGDGYSDGNAKGYSDGYSQGGTDAMKGFTTGNLTTAWNEACPANSWGDYGYEDGGHWIRSTCNICGAVFYAKSYTPNHPAHSREMKATHNYTYRINS